MKTRNSQARKFWNIRTNGDGTGDIDITGELLGVRRTDLTEAAVSRQFYCPDDFAADLAACRGLERVTVNINSPGGDLYMGIAIHNALKALDCKVTTVIQGIAASAASVIFCAGEERLVYPGSCLMVHGAQAYVEVCGYLNEHGVNEQLAEWRQLHKALGVMNACIAATYAQATGKTEEECLALIAGNAETFMTGAEALEQGFATAYADGQAEPLNMVACAGKISLYSGSKLLSNDFHAPSNALELGMKMVHSDMENNANTPAGAEPQEAPVPASPVADKAAEVKAALAADRKRMEEIERLAAKLGSSVAPALVEVAKYGNDTQDPMTPEAFAKAAVMAFEPSGYRQMRAAELAPANNVPVAPAKTGMQPEPGTLNPVVAKCLANYDKNHPQKK